MSRWWVYDIETYPNFFSVAFEDLYSNERWVFEISPRYDHADLLWSFLYDSMNRGDTYVGFNNLHFDAVVIQVFMSLCFNGYRPTATNMYTKAQAIIDAPRGDWSHTIWESDMYIKQVDVFALMHFNRLGAGVSLKQLEVAMRSANVKDLPHPPGHDVPPELYDPMLEYMCWDTSETKKFTHKIWDRIEFRQQLDAEGTFDRSCINWNDVKIGSEYLLGRLRKRGVQTNYGKTKIQTPRHGGIRFADFLPDVQFDSPELKRVYDHFMASTVLPDQTKGFMTNLSATVNGFKMDFGTGGLHGAVSSTTFHAGDDHVIRLDDVESYYPRTAVTQRYYPEHLTEAFVEEYDDLFQERRKYAKGTMQNGLFKLGLNGSFGKLNDKYSPLLDPQAMLAITVTGQLFLARLTEVLMRIPSLTMIQVNTDGVCYRVHKDDEQHADAICKWWMDWTGLNLGVEYYKTFAQRDVNAYLAIEPGGKVKHKGAYVPVAKRQYHQDMSSGVVQIAVHEFVVNGVPLEDTIYQHTDAFDFMLSVKVNRSCRLTWGNQPTQRICRYYISLNGQHLTKTMPPLKGDTEERHFAVEAGWMVGLCNDAREFDWSRLNRRWYLNEAEALVRGLGI